MTSVPLTVVARLAAGGAVLRCRRSHRLALSGYRPGMPVPRAQLKVFAPLTAFPEPEQARLRAEVAEGRGLSRSRAHEIEERRLRVALRTGRAPTSPGVVQVRRVADELMVCPLDLETRAGVAWSVLAASAPTPLLDAALPEPGAKTRLERAASGIPQVLDHPFHAPLHWFLAFSPGEQRFTDPPEGRGPRLTHLTTVGQAATRVERVLEVVEEVLVDAEEVVLALAELGVWLDAFDPLSLLELDHGTAARARGAASLRRDTTCAQLWRAVEALEDGDDHAAAVAYAAARAFWSRERALSSAS